MWELTQQPSRGPTEIINSALEGLSTSFDYLNQKGHADYGMTRFAPDRKYIASFRSSRVRHRPVSKASIKDLRRRQRKGRKRGTR